MKGILLNMILPLALIALWLTACYYPCCAGEEFNWFLFWILAGMPFGMKRMCVLIVPSGMGISGGIGVLALNFIIGGLIGGIVLICRLVRIFLYPVTGTK